MPQPGPDASLYERLGGLYGIAGAVDVLADRLHENVSAAATGIAATLDHVGVPPREHRGVQLHDFRADLTAVTVPTLVIHGDSDAIMPLQVSGKRSAEAIADSALVVIPGGPHGINVTHADQFNAGLLKFLAG